MSTGRRRLPRSRRERGAAALEFGLVSPIVFAVLFGTLTYGLWFNDSLNLRQGLREASRQGVVANYGSENCTMTFAGTAPSANIKHLMCKARSDVGAMTGTSYLKVLLPNGWIRGRELVVCGMVEADRLPGLVPLPGDRMIRWSSRMSIESATPAQAPIPLNPLSEVGGEEQPPAGTDWSWCV
ncbi:MAG: TadE family protein [Nocardioides sp.]